MNNKTRSFIRVVAVLLVLLGVLMEMSIIIIPALAGMRFWLVVVAFGLILITSK